MKQRLRCFYIATLLCCGQFLSAQTIIPIFDTVLFFDGYAPLVPVNSLPANTLHPRNDLYAKKLTAAELQSVGTTLTMNVIIKATCDNYDRISSVNMAIVPKGKNYIDSTNTKIELGRFITPFMDKNVKPDSVYYSFSINNIASLLKEKSVLKKYDIWIELEVFGVPYAAQKQVTGCEGRNDVFYGSLNFVTNEAAPTQNYNVFLPVSFKKEFNNYKAEATDTVGKTTRTLHITVPKNMKDAAIFLITSNHGANRGGEEYIRRNHFVYVDGVLKLQYKPGRTSCEPFRKNNTRRNGIYGRTEKTDEQWQSFSNWCPGDVIDIRRINLGALKKGKHTVLITVPDAIFIDGKEGNFPLSLYLQGKTKRKLPN